MNGTAVANALVAAGVFNAHLADLTGRRRQRNFTLLPTTSTAIVLNGTAAAANGVCAQERCGRRSGSAYYAAHWYA